MQKSKFSTRSVLTSLAIPALIGVVCSTALAEQPDDTSGNEEFFKLSPIEVTTTRSSKKPFNSPFALNVIDTSEILTDMPHDTAAALRHQPGLWVQETGQYGGSPIIRGFMGNRVIYAFDGIRRDTAALFGGPNAFLNNVDIMGTERIEVIRGPVSVLYGSDAIGGIVNVVTTEGPYFTEGLTWDSRTLLQYQTVNEGFSVRQELKLSSRKFFAAFGITRRDIGTLSGGGDVGEQEPTSFDELNLDGQINWQISPTQQLEFFAQNFNRTDALRFDSPPWVADTDRQLYGIRYRAKDVGFVDRMKVTGYYHDQEGTIDEKYWDSDSDIETPGLEAQFTSFPSFANLELVYGFHYHRDYITDSNPQAGTESPDVTWSNPAAYGLGKWQITDRLRLDLGMRVDRFTLESDPPADNALAPAMQDAINNDPSFSKSDLDLDTTDHSVTGSLGIVYNLTKTFNLTTHIGNAFRAPNAEDMLDFGQFTQGFAVPAGSNLDPETSRTFEAGLNGSAKNFSLELKYFYTRLNDQIIRKEGTFGGSDFIDVDGDGVKDNQEQVFVDDNADDSTYSQGVEIKGEYLLPQDYSRSLIKHGRMWLYGNFTWNEGQNETQNIDLRREIPTNALLGVRWQDQPRNQDRNYWVALEAQMTDDWGGASMTEARDDPAFWNDPQDFSNGGLLRSDGRVPGYTVFNLRGGAKINDNATLYLAVENFTDKKYRVKDSRLDAPGINFKTGLELTF